MEETDTIQRENFNTEQRGSWHFLNTLRMTTTTEALYCSHRSIRTTLYAGATITFTLQLRKLRHGEVR